MRKAHRNVGVVVLLITGVVLGTLPQAQAMITDFAATPGCTGWTGGKRGRLFPGRFRYVYSGVIWGSTTLICIRNSPGESPVFAGTYAECVG
jgi:hypothetical protein